MMCIIPRDAFMSAKLDSLAAELVIGAANVSLADVDTLASDNEALKEYVRAHIESFLFDMDDVAFLVWEQLFFEGAVDDECPPDGWQPSDEQRQQLKVPVPEGFYESCGLRDLSWADKLPISIVEKFGKADGGFFGDYFGFDFSDQDEICNELRALGHEVLDESDVVL